MGKEGNDSQLEMVGSGKVHWMVELLARSSS